MLDLTVIDRELEELTIAKTRSFVFADNIRRTITLLDAYWRWYDRLLACSETAWTEADFLERAFSVHLTYGRPLEDIFRAIIDNTLSDFDRARVNVALTATERAQAYWHRKDIEDGLAFSRKRAAEIEIVRRKFGDTG